MSFLRSVITAENFFITVFPALVVSTIALIYSIVRELCRDINNGEYAVEDTDDEEAAEDAGDGNAVEVVVDDNGGDADDEDSAEEDHEDPAEEDHEDLADEDVFVPPPGGEVGGWDAVEENIAWEDADFFEAGMVRPQDELRRRG